MQSCDTAQPAKPQPNPKPTLHRTEAMDAEALLWSFDFAHFHLFEFVLAALSRRRSGSDFEFRISGSAGPCPFVVKVLFLNSSSFCPHVSAKKISLPFGSGDSYGISVNQRR
jgi:hypothetical protein